VSGVEQVIHVKSGREDIERSRAKLPEAARAVVDRAESLCFEPLVFEGHSIGAMAFHHESPDAFTPQHLWLLRQLARRGSLALRDLHLKRLTEERDRYLRVSNAITALLAGDELDMGKVVADSAEALVTTGGYYRVLICLVNGKGTRVQAVASRCMDAALDFKSHPGFTTDFPLDQTKPEAELDIQQWVVLKKRACCVPDASDREQRSPTPQWQNASRLGMRGVCVVPMVLRNVGADDDVLGTLHFEHRDKSPFPETEVELLQTLADQIAMVFRQAQRVALQDAALRSLRPDVRIMDPQSRVLYSNRVQAGTKAGWREPPVPCRAACTLRGTPYAEVFCKSIRDNGKETGRHYVLLREQGKAYDWQISEIRDFRANLPEPFKGADPLIGYAERLLDLSEVYGVLAIMREWLSADGVRPTAERILSHFRDRRTFAWCRIYEVEHTDDGAVLKSLVEYGLQDQKHRQDFWEGKVTFEESDPDEQAWYVLKHRIDLAVISVSEDVAPDTVEQRGRHEVCGLDALAVHNWTYPDRLEKDGQKEFLDAALIVGKEPVGRICLSLEGKLDGPGAFLPTDWELLRLEVLGAAVALYQAREVRRKTEAGQQEAWREAASLAAHQITNKIRPIESDLVFASQDIEKGEVDSARTLVTACMANLNTAMQVLRDFEVYAGRTGFDDTCVQLVGPVVERVLTGLKTKFPHIDLAIEGESPERLVDVSEKCLAAVLDTLLVNSRAHAGKADRDLVVRISVRDTAGGPGLPGVSPLLRIAYQDNGQGIEAPDKERTFEPFFTTDRLHGTGLGLAIVRRHIRRMRGNVVEEGTFGQGACFAIYLPVRSGPQNLENTP